MKILLLSGINIVKLTIGDRMVCFVWQIVTEQKYTWREVEEFPNF